MSHLPFYLFFALAPSVIWILFFLRKDAHPESNRMILKIFFYGMLIAFPVYFVELGLETELNGFNFTPFLMGILSTCIGVAIIEEIFKYSVINEKVLSNPECDEPLDIMLYMIIVALGFAAIENLLILWPDSNPLYLKNLVMTSSLRLVGATLLHALSSGTLGYFLARSFLITRRRTALKLWGLGIAVALHALYNFFIIQIEHDIWLSPAVSLYLLITLLVAMTIFVSWGFKKLKKTKSVCQITINE